MRGAERQPGVRVAGATELDHLLQAEPPLWVGEDVELGREVRLHGPVVLGDGARIGDRAALRETIVLPGTEVPADAILIGAIAGHAGILDSVRPRG
jgi:UDP-3-O-[3-hydroxymyristoyl] glucosamine N-acyltransferase